MDKKRSGFQYPSPCPPPLVSANRVVPKIKASIVTTTQMTKYTTECLSLFWTDGERDKKGESHNKSSREVVSLSKNADVMVVIEGRASATMVASCDICAFRTAGKHYFL